MAADEARRRWRAGGVAGLFSVGGCVLWGIYAMRARRDSLLPPMSGDALAGGVRLGGRDTGMTPTQVEAWVQSAAYVPLAVGFALCVVTAYCFQRSAAPHPVSPRRRRGKN